MRIITVLCIALATALQARVRVEWTAESSKAKAAEFQCYRGETLELAPAFTEYGVSVSNYSASVYWQTNGMGSAWWSTNELVFAPSMDVGAAAYTLFVRAATSNGVSYRANAIIRMLNSPGTTPNSIPLPVQRIDFASTEYANAPWVASSAWLSWLSTNAYIKVELDPGIPAALVIASTNAQAMAAAAQANAIAFAATNKTTILHGNAISWQTVENGTATVWRIEEASDINSATLTVTEALTIDGGMIVLPVGTYQSLSVSATDAIFIVGAGAFGYYAANSFLGLDSFLVYEDDSSAWYGHNGMTGTLVFPDVMTNVYGTAFGGKVTIDYGRTTATNAYPLTTADMQTGITAPQVTNIVRTVVHSNQIWSAAGTNATYQMSWDATNGTWMVQEILP